MMGRTHGVHAEVTTLGYKFAYFLDQLRRSKKVFEDSRKELEQGKISGAVGNYANTNPKIQDYICNKLNIGSSDISTQVLSRDRHATYMFSLSLIGKVLDEVATEIRHLQKTEVQELLESFTKGQKGSSAMPHKKNPIKSENISGLSRLLESFVNTSLNNIAL
jgi:adenylosuccinate lyase